MVAIPVWLGVESTVSRSSKPSGWFHNTHVATYPRWCKRQTRPMARGTPRQGRIRLTIHKAYMCGVNFCWRIREITTGSSGGSIFHAQPFSKLLFHSSPGDGQPRFPAAESQ